MNLAPSRKLAIAIVSAESLVNGFAAKSFVEGVSQALKARGHEVSIFGYDTGPYHQASLFTRIRRYIKLSLKLTMQMRRQKLILARAHFANLPWVLAARLFGIPVIHSLHGSIFDTATNYRLAETFQPFITLSYRIQFSSASAILCVTPEIAEQIKNFGFGDKATYCANGVDSTMFYPTTKKAKKPYAIFPSSLAAWHGLETLLEAVNHPAWPVDLDLVIAGDGVQAPLVREHAAKNRRIRYAGLLPRNELAKIIREAEIGLCLIQPNESRRITQVLPFKLFELMASGVPVVATDMLGQTGVIQESEAGTIVPVNDPAALATAVASLNARSDKVEMGMKGAAYVNANYSWQHTILSMEAIFAAISGSDRSKHRSG